MKLDLTEEDIVRMNIVELYDTLCLIKETEDWEEYEDEIDRIENGIEIKIPIFYITNEWFEPYPSTKKVKVLGYGKIEIEKFYKEIKEREAKMRNIILDSLEDDFPAEAR